MLRGEIMSAYKPQPEPQPRPTCFFCAFRTWIRYIGFPINILYSSFSLPLSGSTSIPFQNKLGWKCNAPGWDHVSLLATTWTPTSPKYFFFFAFHAWIRYIGYLKTCLYSFLGVPLSESTSSLSEHDFSWKCNAPGWDHVSLLATTWTSTSTKPTFVCLSTSKSSQAHYYS